MKSGKRYAVRQMLLGTVAASALMAGTAFAAPPAMTWTGPYVGLNAGWIGSSTTFGDQDGWWSPAGRTYKLDGSGALGGGQVGYNWQFSPFVLGVEADFDFAGISSSSVGMGGSEINSAKLDNLGTIRGRVGYAFDPFPLLLYGTAGVAFGNVNDNVHEADNDNSWTTNEFRAGWTAGGGAEYAFMPNWTVKAEVLYVDLGSQTVTAKYGCRFSFRDTAVVARGGINYKF